MKIHQLQSLVAIEQEGSISAAAKKMNVTVPAIIKSIRNLEEELGMSFIDRSRYRKGLSDYGKHLSLHAHGILSAIDEAKLSLRNMQDGRKKQLLVDAAPALLPEIVPQAIVQLRKHIPEAMVQISSLGQGQYNVEPGHLLEGESDVLLSPMLPGMDLAGLSYEPLVRVHLKVLASEDHPILKIKKPTLRSLREHECIVPTLFGPAFEVIKQLFMDSGEALPRKLLGMPSRQTALNMLKFGEFIVIVPCSDEFSTFEGPKVHTVDIDCSAYSWTHFIFQRKAGYKSEIQEVFVRELKAMVAPITDAERITD